MFGPYIFARVVFDFGVRHDVAAYHVRTHTDTATLILAYTQSNLHRSHFELVDECTWTGGHADKCAEPESERKASRGHSRAGISKATRVKSYGQTRTGMGKATCVSCMPGWPQGADHDGDARGSGGGGCKRRSSAAAADSLRLRASPSPLPIISGVSGN